MKFNFFPDIWGDYNKDFLYDTVEHPFPDGRRRREILRDPMTGRNYESYVGDVIQTGDVALNGTRQMDANYRSSDDDDDVFDDQFEEDIQEKRRMQEFLEENPHQDEAEELEKMDLSQSRWLAYDALGSVLERLENVKKFHKVQKFDGMISP